MNPKEDGSYAPFEREKEMQFLEKFAQIRYRRGRKKSLKEFMETKNSSTEESSDSDFEHDDHDDGGFEIVPETEQTNEPTEEVQQMEFCDNFPDSSQNISTTGTRLIPGNLPNSSGNIFGSEIFQISSGNFNSVSEENNLVKIAKSFTFFKYLNKFKQLEMEHSFRNLIMNYERDLLNSEMFNSQ